MVSRLLPAMNVHSLCVDRAMNMKEGREIKLVLSAKLDTSASKVRRRLLPVVYAASFGFFDGN